MRELRILTWHVHGSYLAYLAHVPHRLILPVKPGRPSGYGGRGASFDWPDTVEEVAADEVRERTDIDCVLFQSRRNWEHDQFEILSEAQRRLPRIFLEHDPPRESPTNTQHPVDDPDVLLVHVTDFNRLMWNSGRTPTTVVEHGVVVPDEVRYTGELERGVVVVNGLGRRGRRLGADVFEQVRQQVPLDLVGMLSEEMGGLGEVPPRNLPAFVSAYRFFFNPIRYTSLGLAVCEAMMLGVPVLGLATTEMVTVVENGISGYLATDPDQLVPHMRSLLADAVEAARLGEGARRTAQRRFSIDRFVGDWNSVFASVTATRPLLTRSSR
ncbi:MAG TPA: glycosyltransferase [Acidimicrobiia bacterium]|nr:glycosyltransferase [Acidimicrobiia bacterium]